MTVDLLVASRSLNSVEVIDFIARAEALRKILCYLLKGNRVSVSASFFNSVSIKDYFFRDTEKTTATVALCRSARLPNALIPIASLCVQNAL